MQIVVKTLSEWNTDPGLASRNWRLLKVAITFSHENTDQIDPKRHWKMQTVVKTLSEWNKDSGIA